MGPSGRIAVALLVGLPMAVSAQTETLTYLGSPFTSLNASGNLTNALANAPPENTGSLVLQSPLGDNFNGSVTPLSWTFDASTQFGSIYLNSENPEAGTDGNSADFDFTTNSSGMLTSWNIAIDGGISGGTNSPSWADVSISSNSADSFSTGFSTPSCNAPPGVQTPCYSVSESNSAPGNWGSKIEAAPEIDEEAAASALTLLLGALILTRQRRRSQV